MGRFKLTETGDILWRRAIVASLRPGDGPLHPRLELKVDDLLDGGFRRMIDQRLRTWIDATLQRRLRPLFTLMNAELSAHARGLAYQVAEALGALPRRQVAQQIAELGKEDRRRLRALGLRLGRETVWLPTLGGRASRHLLMRLQAIHAQSGEALSGSDRRHRRAGAAGAETACWRPEAIARSMAMRSSFERLERLSERTHRLSTQGALKWDAALAASLEVPQELVRPLMSELGFVTEGKRAEESYKRRRHGARGAGAAARSQLAVLGARAPARDVALSDDRGRPLRLDKWLWFARFVKTRSLATKLVVDGRMRVNGAPTAEGALHREAGRCADLPIGPAYPRHQGGGAGQPARAGAGGASAVRGSRPARAPLPRSSAASAPFEEREPGAGRPTKRDGRRISQLKSSEPG